jgi:hypothetical protein
MACWGGLWVFDRARHDARRRFGRRPAAAGAAERAVRSQPRGDPTNLLFNVVAVPGSLVRFWRERRLFNSLSALLIAGTLPGVIVGAIIRVEYLSGGRAFMFIAAGAPRVPQITKSRALRLTFNG